MYIMQRKPKAWQERMIKIIEEDNKIQELENHSPDFDSHYDELGYIDEDEEDDGSGDRNSAEVFTETDTMMKSMLKIQQRQ